MPFSLVHRPSLGYHAPDVSTPPRRLFAVPIILLAALAAVSACGGDDDDDGSFQPGRLTDQQTVPTATPWQQAPEVVLLDPNNIQPLPPNDPSSGGDGDGPTETPAAGEPGVCGETYTVISGDTTFGIAEKCGVDPQAIIDLNPDIDPASLSVGQVLIMPEPAAEETEAGQ
jgi:hypothetical protein